MTHEPILWWPGSFLSVCPLYTLKQCVTSVKKTLSQIISFQHSQWWVLQRRRRGPSARKWLWLGGEWGRTSVHKRADFTALQASSERGCSFHRVLVNEVCLCRREGSCFRPFLKGRAKMLQRVLLPFRRR